MCQHLRRVNEYGVSARRALIGYAVLVELHGQAVHLVYARLDVVELSILVQAHGQCLHVASVHAAVGEVALKLHAEALCPVVPVLAVGGYEAAHVHYAVFLCAHRHAVGQCKHLPRYLLYRLVLVALLARLYEVSVLGEARRVEYHGLAVLVGHCSHSPQVLHRYGLPAGRVVGYGHDDERYAVGVLLQGALQLGRVNVALERYFELRLLGLVDGAVESGGLAPLYVALGSVEVRVARHYVAFVYEVREEHVLRRAALVGGYHVVEAREPRDGFLEPEERLCPRVALVAHHQRGPLPVAHGSGAGVGDEVDVHLVGF